MKISPIRKELERFLRAQGIVVRLVMHFDNIQMIKEAGGAGSRCEHPACPHHAGRDCARKAGCRAAARTRTGAAGSIVHRRKKQLNRAAQGFLALMTGEDLAQDSRSESVTVEAPPYR
ncbi:MAG: hypothetical protein WDO73_21935 [Ignavibacteriota bacterium]